MSKSRSALVTQEITVEIAGITIIGYLGRSLRFRVPATFVKALIETKKVRNSSINGLLITLVVL